MEDEVETSVRSLRRRQPSVAAVPAKKKKAATPEFTTEEIYMQKDFKLGCFVGTSLETIYECPKSKGNSSSIMGVVKLRRHCRFTPFTPSKSKISNRKSRAMKLKRLSGQTHNQSFFSRLKPNVVPTYASKENCLIPDINPITIAAISSDAEVTSDNSINENILHLDKLSSIITLTDDNDSDSEKRLCSALSDMELDLENILSQNSINNKKIRSSELFVHTTFIDISKTTPEKLSPNSITKRKTIQTHTDCLLDGESSPKRFHSMPSNRSRVSGLYSCVSLDPLRGSISPMVLSSDDTSCENNYPNDGCIETKVLDHQIIPAEDQSHLVDIVRSKRRRSRMSTNISNFSSDSSKDGNRSLSPTLFGNLSLVIPKKVNNKSRRRSARLSVGGAVLGSLWLGQ